MPIEQALEQWGLSTKEIKVYLAGLELGAVAVQDIAKKTGIERTNVYSILERLIHQGLFTETEKAGKKYFIAESPEKLILKLKERQKDIETVLPELKSIYNLMPNKPKVRFYEGEEGIRALYDDTLESDGAILAFTAWDKLVAAMPRFWDDYVKRRVERGIHIRAVGPKSKEAEYYRNRGKQDLRDLRYTPEGFNFSTEVNIYNNKVAVMTFGKERIGILIESKEIANTWKVAFEIIWRIAK